MVKDTDKGPHERSSSSCSNGGLDEPLLQRQASPRATAKTITNSVSTPAAPVCYYTWWDHMCLFLVLPFLLCLQFAMALRYSAISVSDSSPTRLSLRNVTAVVALFSVISYLYKRTCLLCPLARTTSRGTTASYAPLILLLPEILVDLVLGTVWLGSVELGWIVLVVCTLGLGAAVVAVGTLRFYVCNVRECVEDEDALELASSNDDDSYVQETDDAWLV